MKAIQNYHVIENKKSEIKKYIIFSYVISMLLIGLMFKNYLVIQQEIIPYNSFIIIIFWGFIFLTTKYLKNMDIPSSPSIKTYSLFIFYISIYTILIYYNSSYNYELLKIYYFIPVLLSAVNFGQRFGFIMAGYSGLNIILLNIFMTNFSDFNYSLLIIILLFWITWLTGGLIDLERTIQEKLKILIKEREKSLKKATSLTKKLKKSQKLLELNFEGSHVGKAICGLKGEFIKTNSSLYRILGYAKKELANKNFKNFISRNTQVNENIFHKLLAGEMKSYNSEEKFTNKQGEDIWVKQNITLARDTEKNPLYFLVQMENITEKKKAERKIKKQKEEIKYNKLRNKFFAKISHELKTPLNLIFTSLHMLKNKTRKQKTTRYISLIEQNSYRLLRIVNNIIDLTKINSNNFELNCVNCDIIDVIRKIVDSTRDYIENKNRKLKFKTEIEEKVVTCDPFNIERILLNLISNAIKFTEEGDKISIIISQKKNDLFITVEDTGIGIKKENQEKIFRQFRQVDDSFTRNNEGSGIGLSIVKSLVDLHNGNIRVESEYGKGSKFIINLPIRTDENNNIKAKELKDNLLDKIDVEFSDIYDL